LLSGRTYETAIGKFSGASRGNSNQSLEKDGKGGQNPNPKQKNSILIKHNMTEVIN
jgi:hypothetical protein